MIISSKKIFIGSSLFFAFMDRANLNHAKAIEIVEFLAHQKYQVYTSEIVVFQTFNAIERDLGSTMVTEFLQAILESSIQILYSSEADLLAAYRYIKANPGHQNPLPSIVNANLMQKNDISSILTFDFWPNIMGTTISKLVTA